LQYHDCRGYRKSGNHTVQYQPCVAKLVDIDTYDAEQRKHRGALKENAQCRGAVGSEHNSRTCLFDTGRIVAHRPGRVGLESRQNTRTLWADTGRQVSWQWHQLHANHS
jgi:hypothetical protein